MKRRDVTADEGRLAQDSPRCETEPSWVRALAALAREGLARRLPEVSFNPNCEASELVLCSNDYLALSGDSRVKAAASSAIERAGAGSTGSRLLSGNTPYHVALEEELCRFTGYEACVLFGSGYHANAGVIPALGKLVGAVFSDELNHASIVDGCRLAKAQVFTYRHCDLDDLRRLLDRCGPDRRALIVTEGVFSMDGHVAPLSEISALARRYGAILMVDDAHGFGVLGRSGKGTIEELGLREPPDIYMATLGKALGSSGAFVCGSQPLMDYITSTARTLLYSTSPAPAACAAAAEALRAVKSEPWRREKLRRLASLLRAELERGGADTGGSTTHVVPVIAGSNEAAGKLAEHLLRRGFLTRPIRYPTVPRGTERVRLSVRCDMTEDQMRAVARAAIEALDAAEAPAAHGRETWR